MTISASLVRLAGDAPGAARPASCRRISAWSCLQLRAGLDAELVDEARARVLVDLECLRLPARAVEREHQLPAEASRAAGARATSASSSPIDVAVPAELEVGLDPLLERDEP